LKEQNEDGFILLVAMYFTSTNFQLENEVDGEEDSELQLDRVENHGKQV